MTEAGDPRRGSGLRRLLDLTPAEFAAEHWGRVPRHIPADARTGPDGRARDGELFDLAAVDELVSTRGLRTPFLRVARDGRTRPDADFTRDGGVGARVADQLDDTALLRLFAEGSTLVLQGLHRTHPPVLQMAQDLAADLGHPVQVNAYVTPPQSTGFSAHYDVHDVFVLQVAGDKAWRIHAPVHHHPLRDEPWEERRADVAEAATGDPYLEVLMRPGDVLYLPRGWLHSATAQGATSAHLTIGVHTWHRGHVADAFLAAVRRRLAADEAQRISLRLGTDVGDPAALADDVAAVRETVLAAAAEVGSADVADDLAGRHDRTQRPGPVAPVATAEAAAAIPADGGDLVLALRPHVRARVAHDTDGTALLTSRAGRLRVAAADADTVATLVAQGRLPAADLGGELARQLVLAGVAVLDTSPRVEG